MRPIALSFLLATALLTAATVAPAAPAVAVAAPTAVAKAPAVEIVFVVDTTGSMTGLIEAAKSKVWSIVNEVLQRAGRNTSVRVGLVAYRDRGDEYVTRVQPVTDNLDKVYEQLMALKADGGGDAPEDVRMALRDALEKSGWAQPGPRVSQVIFLVGDAPPHDDYADVPDTGNTASQALQRGLRVNAIQCGVSNDTAAAWRRIAILGGGEYFAIAQDGGVQVVTTPFDDELAALGQRMGETYLAYGQRTVRAEKMAAQAKMESRVAAAAPAPARADRAVNKAINALAYDGQDLLQQIENSALKLADVKPEDLPDALRALPPAEREATVGRKLQERQQLRARIMQLSKQRDAYRADASRKSGQRQDAFDTAVARALAKQLQIN